MDGVNAWQPRCQTKWLPVHDVGIQTLALNQTLKFKIAHLLMVRVGDDAGEMKEKWL